MTTRMPEINAGRLWDAHMRMAAIGPTPEGGSNRMALTAEDTAARALLLDWCRPLGLTHEQDAIGNMFLRRPGTDPSARAVAFGSHLDTVPTGGRFDGVFGVLAGLEVLRALHEAGVTTRAPLELVNWMNEEGSRFRPSMMGSRVHVGDLALDTALATTDDQGVSVAEAMRQAEQGGSAALGPRDWACWLEGHIEQGPIMEATGTDIGIVTGTVQARYFQLVIKGEPAHVAATTMDRRRDSLAAAAEVILAVERLGLAQEPGGRTSAAWIENRPNARGNVPDTTHLQCDMCPESPEAVAVMEAAFREALAEIERRRRVAISVDPYATFGPIRFDPGVSARLRDAAQSRQLTTRDMTATAGHDSVLMAAMYPSALFFIPSVGGITHNPREYSTAEQIAHGARSLLDAVLALSM